MILPIIFFFIKFVTKKMHPHIIYHTKEQQKKEKTSFERGAKLCQRTEDAEVLDSVMITAAG